MPKFGQVHFGNVYFGDSEPPTENWKRSFANIPLGIRVRRQLGKQVIFRVRRGNGHAGAVAGIAYQDKYGYVVPSGYATANVGGARQQWIAAVDYWRNILPLEEKQAYNVKATKGFRMSGFNLFMRAAMNGEIAMFVDRGDPAAVDFIYTDLTTDGTWRELDLSGIIPATARGVLIELDIESAHVDNQVVFRKLGNTNEINHTGAVTKTNNKDQHKTCIVATTNDRKIEYKADTATWSVINIAIRGWWT